MSDANQSDSAATVQRVVEDVSRIVTELTGVQLGPKQYSMVESRLRSRIMRLGLKSFDSYSLYLQTHLTSETQTLLSLITTHHTYFFREFSHFEFLLNQGLQSIIAGLRQRGEKKIRVWSAACSRGQEAYSIAMFLNYHLKEIAPDIDFEIIGSDVDPESVAFAQNAVYKNAELKQIPALYAQDHWSKGSGKVADFAKVREPLRRHVKFMPGNILEADKFLNGQKFDLIFCRNVFIYFSQQQIDACTDTFHKHLHQSGYLFVGLSESVFKTKSLWESPTPAVYKHWILPQEKSVSLQKPPEPIPAPAVLKVLCVDDSAAIHALLKRILTREHNFEIVGNCMNGEEALKFLASGSKVDVITLDLHMPVVDGLGFLTQTQGKPRPPILVVSSVNRDDTSMGQKALSLGAYDYVEKPSLQNLGQASDEIRSKLRLAARTDKSQGKQKQESPVASSPGTPSQDLGKKKVLIVDDSATIRNLLRQILSQDPNLSVVAEAEKPSQVEELILKHRPDVMTLDIVMPEQNGVELLRALGPKYKIPTIVISSISKEEGPLVLQALELGAFDYIQKPSFGELSHRAREICECVRLASRSRFQSATSRRPGKTVQFQGGIDASTLILLGSSTGGTEALRVVFEMLPAEIPPILVVQHIPPIFSAAFAQRLNTLCRFAVKEAANGEEIKPNTVYIAPGGFQMGVVANGPKLFISTKDEAPVNRHKPSVDYLFDSVARIRGLNITAGVLTGMGADGARGLKTLRSMGAKTFAQDQATSIVYGMPKEAFEQGGAMSVVALEQIAQHLVQLATKTAPNNKAS